MRQKCGRGGGKRPIRSHTAPLCSRREQRVSYTFLLIIYCALAGRNYLQRKDKNLTSSAAVDRTAAAQVLGVSRPTMSSLLNSKAGLSGDKSLRIEKSFGVKMDTLMRMQSAFDIAQTRKREGRIRVRRVVCAA